jgi:cytidylate kinase
MTGRGISPDDAEAVIAELPAMDMAIEYENGVQKVIVGGEDVMPYIRTPRISRGSSDIAVIPEVRVRLVEIQRGVSEKYDIVMDGRDIGTYVLPGADHKFFLTAGAGERARRRYLELVQKDPSADVAEIEKEILARDKNDSSRSFAPLRQADDAALIDTTDIPAEEVVDWIVETITGKQ